MKKLMMTMLALGVAFAGVGIGSIAHASIVNTDQLKCETGMRCTFCNGTGFGNRGQSNFPCSFCHGTGHSSSY